MVNQLVESLVPSHQADVYFSERRVLIDHFVDHHLTWPGTLCLHRAAFGFDLLRAPVNVALSPVLVLARVMAWVCRRLNLPRLAGWLGRRRILLRTRVSARIEAAILTDLLDVPLLSGADAYDRQALSFSILSAPRFREIAFSQRVEVRALASRILDAIGEYTGTRSAMAEFTTALFTLMLGAIAFQALTPGMISIAPGVAEAISRSMAVANFPFGKTLGELWFGVFPIAPAPWLVAATVTGIILLGSMSAAFAGLIADPVQVRRGIHRRRLLRLVDTLEAEMIGADSKPFVAREHYFVRLMDVFDAALSMFRAFRG